MPIQELPPEQCHDLRETDPSIVHLDVRTPDEFAAGHPEGALNVPIFLPGGGGMTLNPDFTRVVERLAPDRDRRVVLSCAMGGRSMRACHVLEQAGYTRLVNMTGGFAGYRGPGGELVVGGWQDAGLPVSTDASAGAWERLRGA
ncbi:MAG: rhodanese-like domain-containing protein [Planctomycetes bacterium]|nr:rhodanese-like domain-containing protein [Planctomycetota bacterium]